MNRILPILTIGVVTTFFYRPAMATWDQPPGARVVVVGPGCDYPGFDYSRGQANDAWYCGNRCLEDSYCNTFEFNTSNHICYLKNARVQIQSVSSDGVCGFVGPRFEW
jgi:hypothetical protein